MQVFNASIERHISFLSHYLDPFVVRAGGLMITKAESKGEEHQ